MASYSSDDKERQHQGAVYYKGPRGRSTGKLIGLFTATAVVVGIAGATGAFDDDSEMVTTEVVDGMQVVETQGVTDGYVAPDDPNYCIDENGDNYCDDDGSSINPAMFMLIAAANIDTDVKTKKYYRSGTPDTTRTYRPPNPASAGKPVSTPPASTTNTTPPTSSKGTGTVVPQGSSSSTASKPSTSSPSTSVSSSSSKSSTSSSSSSSSGISKSSGSGGIGSSSSSSSS